MKFITFTFVFLSLGKGLRAQSEVNRNAISQITLHSETLNFNKHKIWLGDQTAAGSYFMEDYSRSVIASEKTSKHTLTFPWFSDTLAIYAKGYVPYFFTNLNWFLTYTISTLTISDLTFTPYAPLDTLVTTTYYTIRPGIRARKSAKF